VFTTTIADPAYWRWTVAKNGKETTVGKIYCRQGKTSFCLASLVVLSISRRGSLKRNQSVSIGVELRRKGVILSELQKS